MIQNECPGQHPAKTAECSAPSAVGRFIVEQDPYKQPDPDHRQQNIRKTNEPSPTCTSSLRSPFTTS